MSIWTESELWLELPEHENLQHERRQFQCTALGGPRGSWRLVDDGLWLVGLDNCGRKIPLETIYGGSGEPVLAVWITANIMTYKGRVLCNYAYGPGLYETTLVFEIEQGKLKKIKEIDNKNNPAIKTVEEIKKEWPNLDRFSKSEKKEIYKQLEKTLNHILPCLSPKDQLKLRGVSRH